MGDRAMGVINTPSRRVATMSRELILPELMEPGRKPIGAFDIDRNNQYGRHVVHAFIPTNSLIDVVDGPLIKTGDITVNSYYAHFSGGENILDYSKPLVPLDEISVLAKIRRDPTAYGTHGILSDKDRRDWGSAKGFNLCTVFGGTGITMKINSAEVSTHGLSSLDKTEWYHVAGVWKKGQHQDLYINSVKMSLYSTGISDSFEKSPYNARIGSYYTHTFTNSFFGDIEYVIVLNLSLSEIQQSEFYSNPYQILKPAGL